ncbi:MAG: restriction endonuclease subunit S [Alphaproteobacteria bacterium]|nr:restriction endonuclease subunit S [Alphaproteobacteria bacterium]
MKLSDREWREFKIEDLFKSVNIAKSLDYGKLNKGATVFIGRQETNNAIQGFVDATVSEKKDCITISMVATKMMSFWQQYDFATSQNILILRNRKYNVFNTKFICSIFNNYTLKKYNYGNPVKISTFPKEKILLPTNSESQPDYEFMEDYTKKVINDKKQEYIEYAKNKLKNIRYKAIEPLEAKKWKEFFIEDIFKVSSGKRLTKQDMLEGDVPFIGSSDSNNGITNFTSSKNSSLDKNVLGVNYNGSVVENFYHKYDCLFSDDVKRFHLLNYTDNEFVLIFFKSVILKQKEKYSYGYKFNEKRMLRQYIMLPIDKIGRPDYEYMEQYSKNIIYKKLNEYLDYTNK